MPSTSGDDSHSKNKKISKHKKRKKWDEDSGDEVRKHKHNKHHKSDKKEKALLKQAKKMLRESGAVVEKKHKSKYKDKERSTKPVKPPVVSNPISLDNDYFLKSTEFQAWLRSRGKFFEDLSSSEARKIFSSKFVPRWNAGELDKSFYSGLKETQVAASTRTKHAWGFAKKLSSADMAALQSAKDSIDTDTHRKTQPSF